MEVSSKGGARYALTCLDDATVFAECVPLRAKSDAPAALQRVLTEWETQTGERVKVVQSDRGGEYVNGALKAWYASRGIHSQVTTAYTPEQNGKAERLNRVLEERVRAMLCESKLGKEWWAEAWLTATYLRNLSPYSNRLATPTELFRGVKPDLSMLRVFGSTAYVHVPKQTRSKLDLTAWKGIFLGYFESSKAYRVYKPQDDRVVESRDVVVDESVMCGSWLQTGPIVLAPPLGGSDVAGGPMSPAPGHVPAAAGGSGLAAAGASGSAAADGSGLAAAGASGSAAAGASGSAAAGGSMLAPAGDPWVGSPLRTFPSLLLPIEEEPPSGVVFGGEDRSDGSLSPVSEGPADAETSLPVPGAGGTSPLTPGSGPAPEAPQVLGGDGTPEFSLWRGTRIRTPTLRYSDKWNSKFARVGLWTNPQSLIVARTAVVKAPPTEPTTLKEALASPYADQWVAAMREELDSVQVNGTFSREKVPPGVKPLGVKWVFTLKRDALGNVVRFKARLVAKGYLQRDGIDVFDTYAPVSRPETFRMLMAMAALRDLEVHQLDVKTAFLYGVLDPEEQVWVEQPEGFAEGGREWAWRLQKALYGLRQAPPEMVQAAQGCFGGVGVYGV